MVLSRYHPEIGVQMYVYLSVAFHIWWYVSLSVVSVNGVLWLQSLFGGSEHISACWKEKASFSNLLWFKKMKWIMSWIVKISNQYEWLFAIWGKKVSLDESKTGCYQDSRSLLARQLKFAVILLNVLIYPSHLKKILISNWPLDLHINKEQFYTCGKTSFPGWFQEVNLHLTHEYLTL